LNFKGVQTFLEKSDKFSKVSSAKDTLEYNFTLAHLYSNIESFFTSGKMTLFHTNQGWPLKDTAPSIPSMPLFQTRQGVF
jgi:hypothetical protein